MKEARKEMSKSEEEKATCSPRLRLSARGQSHGLRPRKMPPWRVTTDRLVPGPPEDALRLLLVVPSLHSTLKRF